MKPKPKVILRADGSSQTGLGHVIRSCALASMINEEFDCHFVIRQPSDYLKDEILKCCVGIEILPEGIDYLEEVTNFAASLKGDEIIVLDGYHFETLYQQEIKNKGCKLVCIDDIHDCHFMADVIINHSGGLNIESYDKAPLTQLCLGLSYALLRPDFLKEARNRNVSDKNDIFICLGGADIGNDTIEILHFLEERGVTATCNVIVGSAYLHNKALDAYIRKTKLKTELIRNASLEQMITYMRKSKFGICSPSTVSYEYLSVGGELYLKQTADNQKDVLAYLLDSGLAFELKDFMLVDETAILKSKDLQNLFFDGRSDARLKKIFKQLVDEKSLTIRIAKPEDADLYYGWVNDPDVRRSALNTAVIPYDSHISWFHKKCSDSHSTLYIIQKGDADIGQVRFDINASEKTALISYSIDKRFRNTGLGLPMLKVACKKFAENISEQMYFKATVRTENVSSIKIFEKLGFSLESQDFDNDDHCHHFIQLVN